MQERESGAGRARLSSCARSARGIGASAGAGNMPLRSWRSATASESSIGKGSSLLADRLSVCMRGGGDLCAHTRQCVCMCAWDIGAAVHAQRTHDGN
eukprot:1279329-Rhodomonas_salina.1